MYINSTYVTKAIHVGSILTTIPSSFSIMVYTHKQYESLPLWDK